MTKAEFSELLECFKEASGLIRDGDHSKLEATVERTEALAQRLNLNMRHLDPSELLVMKRELSRNRSLLHAASRGTQTAIRRISELRRVQDGTALYSPDGARTAVDRTGSALRKRT